MSDQYEASAINALRSAVTAAGSQSAFARATGATQQSVSYWLKHNKPIAAEFVLNAERATGVSKHLLRPDIYPADLSSISLPFDGASGSVGPSGPTVDFDRATILKRAGA